MEKDILKILIIIKQCLMRYFTNFPISCCYESALVIESVFAELGYNVVTVEGELCGCEHYWNTINGMLLDLTSSQFGEPCGIIADKSKYNQANVYSLDEELEYFDNEEDADIYDELEETKETVNFISRKCLKMILRG